MVYLCAMNRKNIIDSLDHLGRHLKSLPEERFSQLAFRSANENSWFTQENIRKALRGATNYLNRTKLEKWLDSYPTIKDVKNVGLVLAGNIPLVGLHDIISVISSGHVARVKPSSKDRALLEYLLEQLRMIDPELSKRIILSDKLKNIDAVIATGSDNTARYFHQYFSKYPHIIRKNRSSVALINGSETTNDFRNLGEDIFTYFGLGCRNISKLYVPEGYSFAKFFESIQPYQEVMHHHKYHNNYDYNKSVLLVNKEPHLDNGFLLLQKSNRMVSPISVLYFEEYTSEQEVRELLESEKEKIQCIVSAGGWLPGSIAMGQAQLPELWDYADQVDTMDFLVKL